MSNIYNTVATNALNTAISTQLNNLNLGVDAEKLKNIADKVSQLQATNLVDSVTSTSNQLLNDIPKQLIGSYNPVDLINSNLNSQNIVNTLSNIVDNKVGSTSLNTIVASVQKELNSILPVNSQGAALLDTIKNSLENNLKNTVNSLVSNSLNNFATDIFKNVQTVQALAGQVQNLYGSLSSLQSAETFKLDDVNKVLDTISLNYTKTVATEVLNEVKKFDIKAPDNQEKLEVLDKGFQDPSATYPTADYSNQPETNKLARGEIKGTEVEKKNNDRIEGIKLPFGNSFNEPESAFNGEYPYNKTTKTESGHLIEIDDTPGCERLHVYHRSGTYIEIDSNGTVVKRARGSSYEIIDKNGKIAVRGTADISVNGACNIYVGNDVNMEVVGNVNVTSHNDITVQAAGVMNLTAAEEINIHSNKINIEADNLLHILGDEGVHISSGVDMHVTANSQMILHALKDLNVKSKENVKIDSVNNIEMYSRQNINADSTGGKINLNSQQAVPVSMEKEEAETSNAGLLKERIYIDKVSIPDPEPVRYSSRLSEQAEGYETTEKEYKDQKDEVVTRGVAPSETLDDPNPVEITSASPSSVQTEYVTPDQGLLKVTELPGNYKLSPNFVLDNMWRTVAVSPGKHTIRGQRGLTYGQIVLNLQALALNVLEPVKKLYPMMKITSCFRHDDDYPKSAHSLGLAVDMQFPGFSKNDYYDIANKLATILKYDQLLLEYWAQSNSPWIHVGIGKAGTFEPSSMRNVAWTFKDHKLFKQSLVNLA